MTALSLTVVSIDAVAPPQAIHCQFSGNGGTLGRDETNSLPLPDKHRRVSRLHATISFPGGVATITNSSTSLPISVGDQQLDSGESVPLGDGVLIEVGPYLLQAVLPGAPVTPASAATASPEPPPFAAPLAPPPPPPTDTTPQPAVASVSSITVADVASTKAVVAQPLDVGALFGSASPTVAPVPADDPLLALLGGAATAPVAAEAPARSPASPADPLAAFAPISPMPGGAAPLLSASAPSPDPFANLLVGIGAASAPVAQLPAASASGVSLDPLAALGGHAAAPAPRAVPALSMPSPTGVAGNARVIIPEDFNPFEMPSDIARNSADPLAGLLGQPGPAGHAADGATPSIDSLFQSPHGASTGADPAFGAAPGSGARHDDALAALLGTPGETTDPLALFGAGESSADAKPMRDDASALIASFAAPAALPPSPSPAPGAAAFVVASSAPPPTAPTRPITPVSAPNAAPNALFAQPVAPALSPTSMTVADSSAQALTEAFLRGAGLPPSALPQGLTPELMAMVGSVLRSATAGAVDMLAARAATKREVQASVTIISVQANNPLKFLPNADAALLQLLGKKMPGFMRADVAMRDAFDDLRAHEVGVIAGTRAALAEVLGKFDPAVLGEKLARGSVIESLLPSARKAKLWDVYLDRYQQIRREAEDDFQSIFGRAFVQAYERETARIKSETPLGGGERGA